MVALSLTCSRWHNKISSTLDKDLERFLPVSYGKCNNANRNDLLGSFYSRPDSIRDLQLFEFEATPTKPDDLEIMAVPWAPHIIFIKSFTGFAIFDLKEQKVVRAFDSMPDAAKEYSMYRLLTFNTKRKLYYIYTVLESM